MMQGRSIGVIVVAACLAGSSVLQAQAPVQIHPAVGQQGGRVLIAVISDRFTAAEEPDFNTAAANFIHHALLADPDYAKHADGFTIKTVFKPWVAGGAESLYGYALEAGVSNCSVYWKTLEKDGVSTTALVNDAAQPAKQDGADPPRIVVIGNHDYAFGCAHDNWVYLAAGSVGHPIIQHEFGHLLAGLFDEYALPENANLAHPPPVPNYLNCATDITSQPWGPLLAGVAGCDLYGAGIYHPAPHCKMGLSGGAFCKVCAGEMTAFFSRAPDLTNPDLTNPSLGTPQIPNPDVGPLPPTPPPPAPPAGLRISGAGLLMQPPPPAQPPASPQPAAQPAIPTVQVLVRLNSGAATTRIERTYDSTAPAPGDYRRRGDYVYEVSERGKPLALGVVTGDPFDSRAYQGRAQQHAIAPTPAGTIFVSIPNATRAQLLGEARAVEIAVYRLGPSVGRGPITPSVFADLRAKDLISRVSVVSADQLKAALKATQ